MIDPVLRRRVLLFDWWILNFDRTDDNPNLLWDPLNKAIHVIDHNLAFDREPANWFWSHHIFRAERSALSDPHQRSTDSTGMEAIIQQLPGFWSNMPDSWMEVSELTVAYVDMILRRCKADEFSCPK